MGQRGAERGQRAMFRRCAALFTLLLGWFAIAPCARAQIGSDRYSSIVIDAADGSVLSAASPDEARYPASLTKMMTLYMTFEALRDRRIALTTPVPVSARAASIPPSKLGLLPGTRLTVEEAILGLVTKSANDAATAIGELLGGDEDRFADMMTLRARALGMTRTVFRNASGLPDQGQVSTAHDLALLARRLITDFPEFYGYFSTPGFLWHGQMVPNHDHMLETYPGADGLKTGYTVLSGFNLVTSAAHDGVRLIGVVMGAASSPERDRHMAALLDAGFDRMGVVPSEGTTRVARGRFPSLIATAQATTLSSGPVPHAITTVAEQRPRSGPAHWAVAVGAFSTEHAARAAAELASRVADDGEPWTGPIHEHGPVLWRAEVVDLDGAGSAQDACAAITRRHLACAVIRPERLAGAH